MRIRKHAKISPLVYASSSLNPGTVIQTHVCQLNQSPWDVMTFPPSDPETPPPSLLYQVDNDDAYMANGTFADCIAADRSAPSMKFEVGDETQKWDHDVGIPPAERFDNGGTEIEREVHKDGEITLCCKSDGKGWQCRRKAKEGHTLCEHHSSQVKTNNSSNLAHSVAKKSEKPPESRRRPRPKKPALSSNPYEYYYYSGFGPRWGKKRGPATRAEPYTSSGGSDTSRNDVEVAEPNTPETNNNGTAEEAFPSPSPSPPPQSSQMDIERFDYIEDEEEEEEEDEEIGETEKKRARKPIKARSLKSLM